MLGALCAGASTSDYTGWRKSDGTPQSVMLSYYDGPDTRGFAWQTATKVTSGKLWVVAGEHGSGDKAFDSASSVTAASESHSDCTTHKAHVTGLSAGTYSYRLGKDGGPYAYGTFAVRAEPQPFVLLNVNDIQTRDANKINYWEWTVAAADRALGGGRNADMIVSGGDFIEKTGLSYSDYVQWGVVADKARVKFADVAWTMSSGNHDTDLYDVVIDEHYQHTSSGHYGCHAYTVGNVHVAAIPYYDSWKTEVGTWLKNDLASASAQNATWRIVSTHYGPYTTGDHGASASSTLIKEFCGICAAGKVDLVLQAHDHTYSKTLPYLWSGNGYSTSETDPKAVNLKPDVARIGGVDFYVNPEGTVYVSAGCAGHRVGEQGSDYTSEYNSKRTYKIAMDTVKVKSSYASVGADASKDVGQPMFGVVTVDGDTLAYDWYVAANGQPTLFDTLRISKTPPEPPKDEDETIEMTLESSPVEVRTIAAQASWTYEVTGDEDCVGIVRMKNADGTATFELMPLKLGTANVIIYTEDGVTPLKTVTVIVKDVPKPDPNGSDEDVTVMMAAGTLTNFVTATASDAWSVKVSDDDYVSAEVVPNGYGQANVIIQALYPDSDSFTVKLYPNATMKSGTSVKTVTVRIVPPETSVSLTVGEEPFVDECWFFEARGWTVTPDPGTAADATLRLPDGSKSATAELTIVPVAAGEETVTVSRKASSGSSTTAMHVYHVTVTEKPKVEPSGEPEEVIAVTLAGGESFTRTFHADEARPWLLGATNEIAAAFGFDVPSESEESVAGYSLRTQEAVTDVPVTLTGQRKGLARIFVGRQDAEGTAIAARFDVTVTNNAPIPVRVIPDPVGKTCGADDPPLTYVTDPERTPEGDPIVLNGVLARAPGEDIGTYDISLGTITPEANPEYLIALDESAAEGAFTIAADIPKDPSGSDDDVSITVEAGVTTNFLTATCSDAWSVSVSDANCISATVKPNDAGQAHVTISALYADGDSFTVKIYANAARSGTPVKTVKVKVDPVHIPVVLQAGGAAFTALCTYYEARTWAVKTSPGTVVSASLGTATSTKTANATLTITPGLSAGGTETVTVSRKASSGSGTTEMYVFDVTVEPSKPIETAYGDYVIRTLGATVDETTVPGEVIFVYTNAFGSLEIPTNATARILVVGGGGGGASGKKGSNRYYGDGGSGGQGVDTSITLPAGTYAITVGAGGAGILGGTSDPEIKQGEDGKASKFAAASESSDFEPLEGAGGARGLDASHKNEDSSAGADGFGVSDITGEDVSYGAAGEGVVYSSGDAEGSKPGTDGAAGTGAGGGGAGCNSMSGAGGSGIVVVRIRAVGEPPERTPYENLCAAFAAGGEYALDEDVECPAGGLLELGEGQSLALDLNGCSILCHADGTIRNAGDLTIFDSTASDPFAAHITFGENELGKGFALIRNRPGATLTVDGVWIESGLIDATGDYEFGGGNTAVLAQGGLVSVTGGGHLGGLVGIDVTGSADVFIDGGAEVIADTWRSGGLQLGTCVRFDAGDSSLAVAGALLESEGRIVQTLDGSALEATFSDATLRSSRASAPFELADGATVSFADSSYEDLTAASRISQVTALANAGAALSVGAGCTLTVSGESVIGFLADGVTAEADGAHTWRTVKAAAPEGEWAEISRKLGAETEFGNEPEIEICAADAVPADGGFTMRMTVAVWDGGVVAAVDPGKVKDYFEATDDLGDWSGGAIGLEVTSATRNADGTMEFTLKFAGASSRAFMRIRVW